MKFDAIKNDLAFWTNFYEGDPFFWASEKAYLDMNRTMTFRNQAAEEDRKGLRDEGTERIRKGFDELKSGGDFGEWHKKTCESLKDVYGETVLIKRNSKDSGGALGIPAVLTYGQAQKWLNMTLKYLWLLYRLDLLREEEAYAIRKYEKEFHVPLDSYILRYAARQDKSKKNPFVADNGLTEKLEFHTSWSNADDYGAYTEYQKALKSSLKTQYPFPLAWELVHWHKALAYYDQP